MNSIETLSLREPFQIQEKQSGIGRHASEMFDV